MVDNIWFDYQWWIDRLKSSHLQKTNILQKLDKFESYGTENIHSFLIQICATSWTFPIMMIFQIELIYCSWKLYFIAYPILKISDGHCKSSNKAPAIKI